MLPHSLVVADNFSFFFSSSFLLPRRQARMISMKQTHRAEKFHRRRLLHIGWRIMYEPYRLLKVRETAVRAQRQWNVLRQSWRHWLRLLDLAHVRDGKKQSFAVAHYHAVLKIKMLAGWQEGARMMKVERRAQLRRIEMRTRVDGWLAEEDAGSMVVRPGRKKLLLSSRNPYE